MEWGVFLVFLIGFLVCAGLVAAFSVFGVIINNIGIIESPPFPLHKEFKMCAPQINL